MCTLVYMDENLLHWALTENMLHWALTEFREFFQEMRVFSGLESEFQEFRVFIRTESGFQEFTAFFRNWEWISGIAERISEIESGFQELESGFQELRVDFHFPPHETPVFESTSTAAGVFPEIRVDSRCLEWISFSIAMSIEWISDFQSVFLHAPKSSGPNLSKWVGKNKYQQKIPSKSADEICSNKNWINAGVVFVIQKKKYKKV